MGQLDSIFNAADKYLSQAITGAINKKAELVNQAVESDLQGQWMDKGVMYDAQDYNRQRISNQVEYEEKCELLEKMGVPYATTYIGSDMVLEIPKEIDQSQTTELYKSVILTRIEEERRKTEEKENKNVSYNNAAEQKRIDDRKDKDAREDLNAMSEILDKRDELSQKESGLTGTMDSSTVFKILNEITESDTYGYHGEKYDNSNNFVSEKSPFRPQESILNNLDTFGYAVSLASRAYNELKSYGDNENDVFANKTATHSTGRSKEALVVDGEVIIDGQIVGSPHSTFSLQDKQVFEGQRDEILQKHQERLEKAHDYTFSTDSRRRENAYKIENSVYDGALKSDIQSYTVSGGAEALRETDAYKNIVNNLNRDMSILQVKSKAIEGLDNSHVEKVIAVVADKSKSNGIIVSIPARDAFNKLKEEGTNAKLNINEKNQVSQLMDTYAAKINKDIVALEIKLKECKEGSTEYLEIQSKMLALKAERDGYLETGKKFAINDSEKSFLTAQVKTVNSLNRDFGLHISAEKYLTTKDLVSINEKFLAKTQAAGVNVLKKGVRGNYKIDVELLKGLDAKTLKKIGITSGSRDFLVSINSGGVDRSGLTSLGGLMYSGFLRIDDSQDWAEFRRDMKHVKSAGKHTKSVVTNVRKYRDMRQKEKAAIKGVKGGWKNKAEDAKKKLEEKAREKTSRKVSEEKIRKANDKAIEGFKKKVNKSETSKINKLTKKVEGKKKKVIGKITNPKTRLGRVGGRFFRLVDGFNSFKRKAKEKLLSLGIKAGAAVLHLFLPIAGVLVCVLVVITIIQSIFNAPFEFIDKMLAPANKEETVVYQLYGYMDTQEAAWLDQVLSYDSKSAGNAFENREKLNYGVDYSSFVEYVQQKCNNEIVYKGDKMYINPFAANGLAGAVYNKNETKLINEKYLTKVDKYDGKFDFALSANANSYDKKLSSEKGAEYLTLLSCERGHTKNAKDILCMTDCMYQFSINTMFNDDGGELYSILGKSPAQVNWENFHNKVIGTLKWAWDTAKAVVGKVWNFFKGLFGGKKEKYTIPDWTVYVSGTVGYEAVQTYVATLWNASHQHVVGLGVEYYPVGDVTVKSGGKTLNITKDISQQQASEFGVCKSPITNKFKIGIMQDGRIAPYMTKEGSNVKYALDTKQYKVNLTMAKNLASDEKPCVWTGMGDNKATFDKIDSFMKSKGSSSCWTKESSKTYGDPKKTSVARNGQWYDEKDIKKAKEDVDKQVRNLYNNYKLPADQYKISAYDAPNSKNITAFSRWTSSKPAYNCVYSVYQTRQAVDKYEYDYYWMEFDGKTIHKETLSEDKSEGNLPKEMKDYYDKFFKDMEKEHENVTVKGKYTKKSDTQQNPKFNAFVKKSVTTVRDDNKEFNYQDIPDDSDVEIPVTYVVRKRPVYKTQYKYQGYANAEQRYAEVYKRDCKGHDFKYCGGHICYHSQGIAYSMTNEQILMCGALPETAEAPMVLGYNLELNGYSEIKGKHENVDYSTLSTAISTGMIGDPWTISQGSYIGSKKGLELWTRNEKSAEAWIEKGDKNDKENGGQFIHVSSEFKKNVNRYRDIFDIDTGIEKSSLLFPIHHVDYHEFEGWSADNITVAASKLAIDWYENYEFDIPYEISQRNSFLSYGRTLTYDSESDAKKDFDSSTGRYKQAQETAKKSTGLEKGKLEKAGVPLSEKDIEHILAALKKQYGAYFTVEREKVVKSALGWVGRAHYSDYHTEHDFLCKACESNGTKVELQYGNNGNKWRIVRPYNCTAGNSLGFAKYIYQKNEKSVDNWNTSKMVTPYKDMSNMMPADIIYHKGIYNSNGEIDISKADFKGATVDDFKQNLNITYYDNVGDKTTNVNGREKEYFTSVIKKDLKNNAVIFIGKLGMNVSLSNGESINKDSILTVELQSVNDIGNVWLHYEKPSNLFDTSYSTSPYWVFNPDDRTYIIKHSTQTVYIGR